MRSMWVKDRFIATISNRTETFYPVSHEATPIAFFDVVPFHVDDVDISVPIRSIGVNSLLAGVARRCLVAYRVLDSDTSTFDSVCEACDD